MVDTGVEVEPRELIVGGVTRGGNPHRRFWLRSHTSHCIVETASDMYLKNITSRTRLKHAAAGRQNAHSRRQETDVTHTRSQAPQGAGQTQKASRTRLAHAARRPSETHRSHWRRCTTSAGPADSQQLAGSSQPPRRHAMERQAKQAA